MGSFSLIHWLILGVVILLLFGGNRFSSMMGDVAKGLKSFKQGMADEDHSATHDARPLPPQQGQLPPQAYTPPPQAYTPPPAPYAPPTAEPVPPHSPEAHPAHVEMTPDKPGGEISPPRGVPPTQDPGR